MSRHTTNAVKHGCTFALLALSAAISAVARGQTEGEKPENSAGIEEMVVTGYTTNERLNSATGLGLTLYETPQSVSVMTAQRLADQDLDSLTDVVLSAPGVSAKAQDSTRYSFSARGFSINNYQVDGIPIYWEGGGNAGETQSSTALYERVEIVRGATGLLTGAGNPSASINLVRKHADSRELTGTVQASGGSWNTYGAMGDVSTPLNSSGSIRARVVAQYEQGDSFRDLAEEETSVFYATMDFDLTDNTLLRVGASRQDNEPTASTWGGLPTWHADGSRTEWDRSKTVAADWTTWSSTVEQQYLDLVHDFGAWTAKFSVNNNTNASEQRLLYLSGTPDKETGLGMGASPRNAMTDREQTSISFQLSGEYSLWGQQHDLTFGVVDHEEDNFSSSRARSNVADVGNFNEWDGSYPQPTWGDSGVDIDLTTEQLGIYGATRLSITEPFKVILGGRVADWEQSGLYYGSPLNYGDDNVFIPYTGLLYEFNDQHTVYASYTEIFESQNLQDRNGDFLDPITGESTELGLKSLFFGGALQTTVSVFKILQDNLGQPDGNYEVPGIENSQAYYAAEGAESEGYELEVVGMLTDAWDISFSYTNFDAEDATGAAINTSQPKELLKLYTSYRFGGALDGFTLAGGVDWQGENYTNSTNPVSKDSERLQQDSYSLVSLMARYRFSDKLSLQVNAKNLLDETYYSQIGFYNQLEYGEPRSVTASVNYQF
ncbi:TonB-dependent siderophore receptor [Gilvimarinus xylanilyticus]|uniref:TonB-dependent siderophore receptor n=1 Tax=Gilvimarinus xylanilyticus TaxID=2944139 RepID=A0A9X2I3V3_9GAMM|nr:TonB-dependent siderophore receptor [Gilvimarinus xylanilyticus]MCP8898472.1 TonB-dependent siderophore receptor [Gilvimarinus xylanilyticus]